MKDFLLYPLSLYFSGRAIYSGDLFKVSCGGTGQQWPAVEMGALAAADLGHAACAEALLEEVTISPTIEPPSR